MKILVIYKSKTGFTQWYAEIIAREVEGELIDFKEITVAEELEYISHFYMQSGNCYEKMSFPDKTLMKMMSNVLSKKKNKDSVEEGFVQAIKSSYDISSEKYTEPLVKYLLEG